MEDVELIDEIKNKNCEESFKTLSKRHSNLFYKICHKYTPILKSTGACADDLLQEKDLAIYKSALSFDPTRKTKFSTWLGNFTRYHCLNFINKNGKYIDMDDESIEYLINKNSSEDYSNSDKKKECIDFIFSILSKMKDKRILEVFELRYKDKMNVKPTWANIAKQIGTSTQTVINLHTRGKTFVSKKLKSKAYDEMV